MKLPDQHLAWTWQGSSDPAALELRPQPLPTLQPGDVLVRNLAIGLNPVDWKVLDGVLVEWVKGHVPGVDGAGEVVAVGEGVSKAWIGQRVAYHQSLGRQGIYAQYTPVRSNVLMRIPANVDWQQAASIPCPALTAWLALQKLPAGCQTLLLGGAGSSVAHHLAQLAVRRGLRVATLSSERHFSRLKAMGVTQCLQGQLTKPWQGGEQFDAVIDMVSAGHARLLAPALRANGHLVCVQDRLEQPLCAPFSRTLSVHEVALGASHRFGDARNWHELVAAGEHKLDEIGHGAWLTEHIAPAPFESLGAHLRGLQLRSFGGKALVLLPAHE